MTGPLLGKRGGANLVITLNASADATATSALVQNITYENTDTDNPTVGSRTVRYVLTDGDGGTSATYDTTVTFTPVNDVPTITNLGGDTLAYSEGDGAVVIDQSTNAAVSDVDSADFDTGTLTISFTAGSDAAEDVLAIRNQGTGAGQIGVSGSNVTYGAAVVCNKTMVRDVDGSRLMLGPRSKGLRFNAGIKNVHTIDVDETITLDGLEITGIKATHGNLVIKLGPLSKTIRPGPAERIGWGAIGFAVCLSDLRFVNLGDTLLHTTEWQSIVEPDVLMIPIGGKVARNAMDEDEALEAVGIIRPATVIPCHYNCPGLWTKKLNPGDDQYFKRQAEKLGSRCVILGSGEFVEIQGGQSIRKPATIRR